MIQEDVTSFINSCKVATVCCVEEQQPHCFNCYYAFMEKEALLVYKSSFSTKHEKILDQYPIVAGTIVPEEIDLTTLRGIQFEGTLIKDSFDLTLKASSAYYLRFPFAMAVPGKIYILELQKIKFTDNSKGFGYKTHWEK